MCLVRRYSLTEDKSGVSLYFQHDKNNLLGNTKSGTLKLSSDSQGLKYEARLPDFARDKKELIERGDLTGVSIGFFPEKDKWNGTSRRIEKARLFEISLVDKPAHKTTLSMRDKTTDLPTGRRWNHLIIGV